MKKLSVAQFFAIGLLIAGGAAVTACSSTPDEEADTGPTGSVCPEGSTLTYDNFAKGFADTYCIACHSSTKTGADRKDAPDGWNFDTLAGMKLFPAATLDSYAAAGPSRVNTNMPNDDPRPSKEERLQFGEWLACGRK